MSNSTRLSQSLTSLRNIQKEFKEKALSEVLEPRVRAAYFDAETKLSLALGELDYTINLERSR